MRFTGSQFGIGELDPAGGTRDQAAATKNHAVRRRRRNHLSHGRPCHGDEISFIPGTQIGQVGSCGQTHYASGMRAYRSIGVFRLQVSCSDQQGGNLERVTSSHEIEGILKIIAARGYQHTRPRERPEWSHRPRRRLGQASRLEEQVRLGVGNHGDSCGSKQLGNLRLHLCRLDAQTDTVACHNPFPQWVAMHVLRQIPQSKGVRIQRLVGMKVNGQVGLACQLQQEHHCLHRLVVQMWTPADNVDSCTDRCLGQLSLRRTIFAGERAAVESDNLNIDHSRHGIADIGERLNSTQAGDAGDVDMRTNCCGTVADQPPYGRGCTRGNVGYGHRSRVGTPGVDGTGQIARRVGHMIGGQRLVEMHMRFGESGKDHEPRQVEHLVSGWWSPCPWVRYLHDDAILHGNVNHPTIGQPPTVQMEVGTVKHGGVLG